MDWLAGNCNPSMQSQSLLAFVRELLDLEQLRNQPASTTPIRWRRNILGVGFS